MESQYVLVGYLSKQNRHILDEYTLYVISYLLPASLSNCSL